MHDQRALHIIIPYTKEAETEVRFGIPTMLSTFYISASSSLSLGLGLGLGLVLLATLWYNHQFVYFWKGLASTCDSSYGEVRVDHLHELKEVRK